MGSVGTIGGDALDDFDAGGDECVDLFGIVGHQANGFTPSILRISAGSSIGAAVGGVAELEVGFDGVAALVLQLVGAELGHQADAAAFLLLVEEMPAPASAMVASASSSCWRQSQRSEWKTSPVRHCEWMRTIGGCGVDVAHDQSYRGFDARCRARDGVVARLRIGDYAFEAEDAEVSPAGGEVGVGYFA